MIQALEENGFAPDLVVGTSAGSLVAALFASGRSGRELATIADGMDETAFADWSYPGRGLIRGEALAKFVRDKTNRRDIEQMKIPLGIAATDLDSGEGILFRRGDTGTAVRASSAVPAVFQPVRIGQREYVDGGLSAPIPVHHARQMGAEFVIAVDISAVPEGNPTGDAARMLLQTFAIMGKSLKAYELREADLVLQPSLAGVSGADFTTRRQSIKAGRDVTLAHLAELRERLAAKSRTRRRLGRAALRRAGARRGRAAAAMPSTGITPTLKRNSSTAASTPIAAATASKRPPLPAGHSTCQAKKRARLTITPTTAAVMPVSGAVKRRSPCVDSISGPPRRTKQNDGRKVK